MCKEIFKCVIAGGGTGGHIFPSLAIANELKNDKQTKWSILFVGAKGKMEMNIIPKHGYKIQGLWISGFQRKDLLKNITLPLKCIWSLLSAFSIIGRFQPDLIIGTGGYASAPTLIIGVLRKIPIMLQEQNAYPGWVNRYLGKYAQRICVAYPNMKKFFPQEKIALTGNPLRKDISIITDSQEAKRNFRLNPKKNVALIIGGSQGAETLNHATFNGLKSLEKNEIQVIWQTGKRNYENWKTKLTREQQKEVYITPFLENISEAYAAADLIVSRGGAIALSEIAKVQKPTLIVPSPNVAANHQKRNVQALEKANAVRSIPDNLATQKLIQTLINLSKDKKQQQNLIQNLKPFAHQHAKKEILGEIFKIVRKK
ncbi:MAG: undecaprenyldiphospho-muramoylpentapeptide beta-N-acetylglucosaminyltransferase [Cytophagales bacterium]|nr:undecaprenyldiphospho-muramoylpentapeptide beta-N-acetylglucosaminyltransferase [Cytophagales bacterium]